MENTLVLDTDILIDLIREKSEIVEWIKDNEEEFILSTTIVNIFELYAGAYKDVNKEKKLLIVDGIQERLDIIDFNIKEARLAGKLKVRFERIGMPLDIRDLFIGSIALSNNLPLKTNNKKHFERIEGLELV